MGRAITAVGPPDELLPTIASGVAGALGAAECIIFDYDAGADALTPKALFQRTPTDYQDLGKSFPLAEVALRPGAARGPPDHGRDAR